MRAIMAEALLEDAAPNSSWAIEQEPIVEGQQDILSFSVAVEGNGGLTIGMVTAEQTAAVEAAAEEANKESGECVYT